jgi:hypothetical protein
LVLEDFPVKASESLCGIKVETMDGLFHDFINQVR